MDEKLIPEDKKKFVGIPYKDKPDRVPSDNISLFDLHEDMQTVDAIAVDELTKRVQAESDEWVERIAREESPDEDFRVDH